MIKAILMLLDHADPSQQAQGVELAASFGYVAEQAASLYLQSKTALHISFANVMNDDDVMALSPLAIQRSSLMAVFRDSCERVLRKTIFEVEPVTMPQHLDRVQVAVCDHSHASPTYPAGNTRFGLSSPSFRTEEVKVERVIYEGKMYAYGIHRGKLYQHPPLPDELRTAILEGTLEIDR